MLFFQFTVIWLGIAFGPERGDCKAIGEHLRKRHIERAYGGIKYRRRPLLNRRTSVSYNVPGSTPFSAHTGGRGNDVTVIVDFNPRPGTGGRPPTINHGSVGVNGNSGLQVIGGQGQQGIGGQQEIPDQPETVEQPVASGLPEIGELPAVDEQPEIDEPVFGGEIGTVGQPVATGLPGFGGFPGVDGQLGVDEPEIGGEIGTIGQPAVTGLPEIGGLPVASGLPGTGSLPVASGLPGIGGLPAVDEQPEVGGDNDGSCPCSCLCPSDAFSVPQDPNTGGDAPESSVPESPVLESPPLPDVTDVVPELPPVLENSPISGATDVFPSTATGFPPEDPSLFSIVPGNADLFMPQRTSSVASDIFSDPPVQSASEPAFPQASETPALPADSTVLLDSTSPTPVVAVSTVEVAPTVASPVASFTTVSSSATEEAAAVTSAPALALSGDDIDISSVELHSTLVFGLGG